MKNHFRGDYQKLTRNQIFIVEAKIMLSGKSRKYFNSEIVKNRDFFSAEKFVSFRSAKLGPVGS
jgi:uncharacterized protein (DUF2164 family)